MQKNIEQQSKKPAGEQPSAKPGDRLASVEAQLQAFEQAASVKGDSLSKLGIELSAILKEMGKPATEDLDRIHLLIKRIGDLQTKVKV